MGTKLDNNIPWIVDSATGKLLGYRLDSTDYHLDGRLMDPTQGGSSLAVSLLASATVRTLADMLATTGSDGDVVILSDYKSAPPFRWDTTDGHWKAMGGKFTLAKVGAQAAVTGTTSPTAAYTITIPGGLIGKNGTLELTFLYTTNNDASTKTLAILYGGTQFASAGGTSVASMQSIVRVTNQGSQSVQVSHASATASIGVTGSAAVRGAVNSATNQTLEFRVTLADGTDTAILEDIAVAVVHGG